MRIRTHIQTDMAGFTYPAYQQLHLTSHPFFNLISKIWMVGSEFAWNMNVYIQDNIPCHKAPAILKWFLEHDNEFIVLKCVSLEYGGMGK